MKQLIELAEKNIKDEKLRKLVVDFLKDPKLSHKDFRKYPMEKLENARTLFGGAGVTAERDILNHSLALAELCMRTSEILKEKYGIPINTDDLIAAAILHDIMHLYEYKRTEAGVEHTGLSLDHTTLAVAELYHRGFPEELIHVIAAHAGEAGLTSPRNFEALIFHHLDNMLAMTEFHLYAGRSQQPLMVLDEETIKKIIGEQAEQEKDKSKDDKENKEK
ncbi:MAG TPA: HDIG domain-containing protein [archaeon]|nr:HDIG domain-containing protein [archaeon]